MKVKEETRFTTARCVDGEHVKCLPVKGLCDCDCHRATNCEYGCPYGSEEHEWRLWEWERTGQW